MPRPPAQEDIVEVTPEQLALTIKAIEAMTFSSEAEPAIRLAIRGLKTLIQMYGLLL